MALYGRAGVREYWLVDPEADVVTVHRRAAHGGFSHADDRAASRRDTLTTPLLPGFALPLDEYFRWR